MRLREIVVLFMMLLVIMAVMSIPLWWGYVSPYIFMLPRYMTDMIHNINEFIEMILKSL